VKHTVILQVEAKNKKMQELNRFVHYYSRFKNHENSYKVISMFTIIGNIYTVHVTIMS